jgi:2-C-methyl-D-erythritol 2,4-cyclodiphosphate synthase
MGFDAHRLSAGRPLILGGVRIEHDRGLTGHSDGDVLLHAICDALLGAVAAPDIGSLFPPNEERWRNAPSALFLERAVSLVEASGYRIVQLDAVVIAEEPRLAPHYPAMRARIAEILGVSERQVGLKATTCDGMGFSGRGEGIVAQSVALLARRRKRPRRRIS